MTTFPYSADAKVWIMQPRKVFQARVNLAAASYPLAEVPYDGVTLGSYTDLEMNQTVLIGSTEGAWDLGRTYLRGDGVWNVATSTVLNIGYSSRGRGLGSVDLQDNAYITVLDLHEVWMRPSKDGKLDGSLLMDYALGVPQNWKPVLQVVTPGDLGGIGVIGEVDSGSGVLELDFDANGSHFTKPGGGQSWWDVYTRWNVKDGTITTGVVTDFAITAEFPPGYRYVRWRGASTDAMFGLPRMYLVVALDEDDPDYTSLHSAARVTWTETVEGMTLKADLRERLDPADYLPGTVVLFMLDGVLTFGGWLDSFSSDVQATADDVEIGTTIQAVDTATRLSQLTASATAIQRDANEPYYYTMRDAHPTRYAWRYLAFATSAPMVANVHLNFDYSDDFPFTQFGVSGGSLYSANDLLAKSIIARFVGDETGQLRFLPDPMLMEPADRPSGIQATLSEDDWSNLRRSHKRERNGALRGTAVLSSTTDADAVTTPLDDYYAVAPGPVAAQGGSAANVGYTQIVRSETEFWRRMGQMLGRQNPREALMTVDIAPGMDPIHPSRLDSPWVLMNASQDLVGWLDEALTNARCLPTKMQYAYDDLAATLTKTVTLERETTGPPGARDPRPAVTTTRVVRNPSLSPQPNTQLSSLVAGQAQVASPNADNYMYLAADYDTATPTWSRYSLTALGMAGDVVDFIVDPYSPLYLGTGGEVNGLLVSSTHAYWLTDIAGTPSLSNAYALRYTAAIRFRNAQGSRSQEGFFAIVSHLDDGDVDVDVTLDGGLNWTRFTDLGSNYVGGSGDDASGGIYVSEHVANRVYAGAFITGGATTTARVYRSDDAGGSFANQDSTTLGHLPNMIHIPFDNSAETRLYVGGPGETSVTRGLKRIDSGVMTDISPIVSGNYYGTLHNFGFKTCDIQSNRGLLVGYNADTVQFGVWSTDDGGDSWTQRIAPSASTAHQGGNIAGDNPDVFFLFGQGAHAYSEDAGANFQDKTGNLGSFGGIGAFLNLVGVG